MSPDKCNCHKLNLVVLGSRPDQRDGLLFISLNNADTLHGTSDNPGGLVKANADLRKELDELKQWRWKVMGGFTAITVLIHLGPHLVKFLTK